MDTLFGPETHEEQVKERSPGAGAFQDAASAPLATRVRPSTLEDFVGQSQLLGQGSALRTAIETGHAHSMILYGPPGPGKTTLARILAEASPAAFEELSAVQAGRAEVRGVIERATHRLQTNGTETILFLDEIHRFNKAQQDALLPAVEDGLITLIGATTENPAFEVNGALLSRLRVYALQALTPAEVQVVLERAAAAAARSRWRSAALEFLAARSEGDARTRAERTRAGRRDRRRSSASSGSACSGPRMPCSGGRSSTTKAETATTTTPPPGSRPPAARTPTPRCTTWP